MKSWLAGVCLFLGERFITWHLRLAGEDPTYPEPEVFDDVWHSPVIPDGDTMTDEARAMIDLPKERTPPSPEAPPLQGSIESRMRPKW
jgi:hypothetical protein